MSEEQRRNPDGTVRIVVSRHDQGQPWRCLVCGAAVAHVDDHVSWHERTEVLLYALVEEVT